MLQHSSYIAGLSKRPRRPVRKKKNQQYTRCHFGALWGFLDGASWRQQIIGGKCANNDGTKSKILNVPNSYPEPQTLLLLPKRLMKNRFKVLIAYNSYTIKCVYSCLRIYPPKIFTNSNFFVVQWRQSDPDLWRQWIFWRLRGGRALHFSVLHVIIGHDKVRHYTRCIQFHSVLRWRHDAGKTTQIWMYHLHNQTFGGNKATRSHAFTLSSEH